MTSDDISRADPSKSPDVTPHRPARRTDVGMPLIVFAVVAVLALALAMTIVTLGDDDSATTDTASTGGAAAVAEVSLTEFALDPATVQVGNGGRLDVRNDGAVPHNLAVVDTDLITADLGSGEAEELDISTLEPGEYVLACLIPGHREAGMEGTLTVSSEQAAAPPADPAAEGAGGEPGHDDMDYAQMTEDMLASFAAFPAATEGTGNEPLEPTEVRADGTKVFDLDMRVAPWEVEAGKVVDAWTFNGVVPGPLIRLELGDRMDLRIHNQLELATDVHLHGLDVENRFDGVAPITQDLIEPGESFTYSYVAQRASVGMYHPHAHGHRLLPDGMFGVILVGDVALPRGETISGFPIPEDLQLSQEIPMVLNDSGAIGYSLNGKGFPATAPVAGKTGEWILVHYFNEGNQIHPMHLHQFEQVIVAKDGFPIDEPYAADTVNVAPGERYSVLIQLDQPGTWVWHCHILPHVERDAGMFGMVTAVVVS